MRTTVTKRAEKRFFDYARARHAIYEARKRGDSAPWTTDPILQTYKFTNVFRELDRTTEWFCKNVREPLRSKPEVLLATVLFRWFNRITVGEAIFLQKSVGGKTAWEELMENPKTSLYKGRLYDSIVTSCGSGPYVTGAYMITTPTGMTKLDGILENMRTFLGYFDDYGWDWESVAKRTMDHPGQIPLQEVWEWVCGAPFMGPFLAYEVVTDLRHTDLLCNAPDTMTWANPGPGALRGAGRILELGEYADPRGVVRPRKAPRDRTCEVMSDLLVLSQDWDYWPQDWLSWEMRDVEHTLCEFDKYERVRTGQGTPRGRYRHG